MVTQWLDSGWKCGRESALPKILVKLTDVGEPVIAGAWQTVVVTVRKHSTSYGLKPS